ncbi:MULTISPECIES: phage tail tape measure protein [unclassified Pseudomonas]|uniref:phage tail tape measure protein n=1 Tax=unclassified Pseudomonas TaxID=196821 RepID=UPI000C877373|nr:MULTISPECIES: phage tail tape measure protein [unclassified Pseudomonas]PMU10435.1 phage tail tape measure protein [Pseudomonas sp. FW305-20]PMU21081.1 phage tail tape measure protein [Pseudomonas sp. FW305-122]PMU34911.1 phage tail tape measure protein [Pseudomonas sp. FW305-47B]PMX64026.1 phage tail tape measure protein [Pseudomonas sp. FW305-33]PMX70858.1 phage tail tape measure protein [Pseudomonas sp. FW305-60]
MADRSASLAFILSLTDEVTAPLGKVKMGFSDLAEQSEKHIKSIGLGLGGLTAAVVGIQQSMAPALEVNRALGDVRSLGVAEDALTALNSKSLAFAVNYGENAREFVASAYQIDGAIKGLVGNQLATFTNASSLVAKATKTDAATMGEYVGTLYNLQKSQADAMGKGAWVEKLGGQTALAVQLFRTSGAAMKDAFKEAGAIATTAGVDLAEQMAVIGTLSSTMEGGDAGGRYKAFFENIGAASEKLGMKFTDQQGKILPIMSILDKLQGKFGDLTSASAGAKLMEAFGGEGAQVIGALAKDTGRLRDGLDQLGKVRGLEKAEQMAQAMVDPWQQWASLVEVMRVVFGQVLIPVLSPFMNKMVEIGKTLVRWSQLFPNITRVIGITALTIMTIIGAMSLLTLTVGIAKMTWLGLLTVWKVLNMTGLRSVAIFLYHTVMVIAFVAGLALMYTWMGVVRTGMLLWQGAVWLVNAALLANPIVWIVIGVIALVAAVAAAISFWDEWTTALLNSEAFKWVSAQLQALSDWFNSMGGWSGMAKAAWDGIVSIFHKAVNGLIELLNSIPGVNIEARFGGMPEVPGIDAATNAADKATAGQKVQQSINAADTATAAQKAQQTINAAIPSISPTRPTAVPPGGLLTSIQNNSNSQNKGVHVENMTIQNSKPMNPLEMENMMAMAVGG